jgi:hypothetical protein
MSMNDVTLWLARKLDVAGKLACEAGGEGDRLSMPFAYDASYAHKMDNAEALAAAALELERAWRYYTIDAFHDYEQFIVGVTVYHESI